jgi:DNA polymerase III sliding clamp (beta) subunit (PCNA family)
MLIKKKPLEFVKVFAGKTDTRYILNGVHITEDYLTATDGKILGRIEQDKTLTAKDYPNVPGIDSQRSQEPLKGVIVPVDGIDVLIRAIPRAAKTMPILKTVIINTQETNAGPLFVAGATDLETTTPINIKPIEGMFPDVNQVIPTEKLTTVFCMDPGLLGKAMLAASKLGLTFVKFEHDSDKVLSPVKITGVTEDGQNVTMVVMPVREEKK